MIFCVRETDDEDDDIRYPPEMIPGMHITIHTTATNDREARLLLGAIGLPFYGKLVN